jgi:hypothetical protein
MPHNPFQWTIRLSDLAEYRKRIGRDLMRSESLSVLNIFKDDQSGAANGRSGSRNRYIYWIDGSFQSAKRSRVVVAPPDISEGIAGDVP